MTGDDASELRADAGDARIASRLVQLREKLGISQGEMASFVGASERTYQRYEAATRSPKLEQLQGLVGLGVDLHWLVTGIGAPLRGAGDAVGDMVRVPPHSLTPMSPVLGFSTAWVAANGLAADHLATTVVRGAAMSPTLLAGDVLLLDTRKAPPVDGEAYLVVLRDQVAVRRLHVASPEHLRLVCDNRAYGPPSFKFLRDSSMLTLAGRVIWLGRGV